LRADNKGEGGVIALTALVRSGKPKNSGQRWVLLLVGLFGAFLLYGDGMITPAISVLSAIEGLRIITPAFNPFLQFFYRSRTPTNEWDLSDVALAGSTFPLFVQKRA
jgi:K+ transporter